MAKTTSWGVTDTAVAGNPVLTLPRATLNIEADYRVKSNQPGKEAILTNITSPIDRPEKFRFAYSEIGNIYNGTSIDASVYSPTKRGVSVLAQLTDILSVTDSTDPEYRIDLPMECHLVIKVPASEYVTGAVVQTLLGRLVSGLFDTGSTATSRLESILRGSLVPSGL